MILETDNFHPFKKPVDGVYPDYSWQPYTSNGLRSPKHTVIPIQPGLSELTGPSFNPEKQKIITDLTEGFKGHPLGEKILIYGTVTDEDQKPVPNTLIEIWQANAAGRYLHKNDQHNAPLDPNFTGLGCFYTDESGRYEFKTIKPGAYPWGNHYNAWRPQHIHFSLFGPAISTRLITQMYFPGDPLLSIDPIFNSIRNENARQRMVSTLNIASSLPFEMLAYEFNLVLRGREKSYFENGD
ncbi:protocatechuate 3,4-dioxygenase subunit beta [Pedobacter sp. AW1-32]|uniref:protocatechuate 3,4-dioxygenase subunit beta n=1 Tax=Pedobacter sp. AW1-32 TaxID=3383026 RepID=UPI003FF14BDD